MSLKKKSRMISFRVSAEEFETLKSYSQGHRSLSEFARSAVHFMIGTPLGRDVMTTQVQELTSRVNVLDLQMERLNRLVEEKLNKAGSTA